MLSTPPPFFKPRLLSLSSLSPSHSSSVLLYIYIYTFYIYTDISVTREHNQLCAPAKIFSFSLSLLASIGIVRDTLLTALSCLAALRSAVL